MKQTLPDIETTKKLFHDLTNSIGVIYASLHVIETQHPEVRTFRHWPETISDLETLKELLQNIQS